MKNEIITTVIFDIGNVLADFRWREYLDGFEYKEEVKDIIAKAVFQNQIWNERDRGLKEEEEYLQQFCENAPMYEKEIREVFAGILEVVQAFDFSDDWVEAIKRQGKKVYFLSNYSKSNFEYSLEKFRFLQNGDGGIISYQVKQIKPEPYIYETLLKKYNINPKEAVFLDDLKDNLETAKRFGIHTIHVTSHEAAVEGLKEYGIRSI
ncbi:MAG: HAD family phosphatase [Lachnospiraceae bacterium]